MSGALHCVPRRDTHLAHSQSSLRTKARVLRSACSCRGVGSRQSPECHDPVRISSDAAGAWRRARARASSAAAVSLQQRAFHCFIAAIESPPWLVEVVQVVQQHVQNARYRSVSRFAFNVQGGTLLNEDSTYLG